jgi:hypothetical protein
MAHDRATLRKPLAERPPAHAPPARSTTTASAASKLQRRLGNEQTQRWFARAQAAAAVSSPHEPAELEAQATARAVMRMSAVATPVAPAANAPPGVQRQPAAAPAPATDLRGAVAGGQPLPAAVHGLMAPRFGARFDSVRIHTDAQAGQLSQNLNAQAFTVGSHVFFAPGKYQPDTRDGRELIAHELTHTIQQGAVVQRSPAPAVVERSPPRAQRLGIGDALERFASLAYNIPGFRMLTVVLGMNPITMSAVERSAGNILRALIELVPGGVLITQALENHGILPRVAGWLEARVRALGMAGHALRQALDRFLDSLSWSDIFDLGGLWERAKRIFTEPIGRLIAFGHSVVGEILAFIREAILLPIARLAEGTRGYDLLKAVLGQDPITGQPVARTPENLIGGFMKLIGQEEVWENLKKANAVARAWAWFQSALAAVIGFVRQIPQLFVAAIASLELADLLFIPKAFAKVAGVFGGFVAGFIRWAGSTVWALLELIFEVVSPATLTYLRKTGAALYGILKNPLPFVRNLVRAAKLGLQNFADNILTHLKAGLIDWLTGSLPGVYIPKAFSLGEIVKFVFSVLGLTWQNIRPKLVKIVGETAVKAMETGFNIVVTLVTEGPAAAWEKIKDQLANLKDTVIGGITDFVVETVIKKAIPKLVSMFIPGAGFVSAILSIYDTIMVFVEKLSKIVQVVASFVDSIVAIAGGAIDAAAKRVESALAGVLSLAISFLAGFLGLGNIADKIMGVIQKIRAVIDKAIDALIAWILKTAKALFATVFGKKGKPDERNDAQKMADAQAAEKDAEKVLAAKGATPTTITKALPEIKKKYRLTSIELAPEKEGSDKYVITVVINPVFKTPGVKIEEVTTPTYEVKWAVDKRGVTVACKAILTEVHVGAKRSSKEKSAQLKSGKSGKKGDQGGHIVGHRFIGEHGLINMFPQNARFNVSDWKIMENEWARMIDQGYGIEVAIFFTDYVAVRPSTILVKWSTYDIATDKTVEKFTEKFTNTKHQN